jgi:hypothetical protein
MPDLDEDEIRIRAHRLWEDEGRPEGQDTEFWFRAIDQLMQEQGSSGRPTEAPSGMASSLQPSGTSPVGGSAGMGSIGTGGAASGKTGTGSAATKDNV